MGQSTDAYIAYGFDLGSTESWKLKTVDEYGYGVLPSWIDEGKDFEEQVIRRLFDEKGLLGVEYWRADEHLDVQIVTHCSGDYPMYVLAVKVYKASRGYPKSLTLGDFEVKSEWHAQLQSALDTLELEPMQEEPAWVLCSYWG